MKERAPYICKLKTDKILPMSKNKNMYKIVFLRHGESTGNAEGYFQGQGDFPLTKRGQEQTRALAERWLKEKRKFDYVIASPLSRTRETVEILAEKMSFSIDEFDPIWMERHNGEITGMKHEEGRKKMFPSPYRNPYQTFAGNGESDFELFLRAGQAIQSLLMRPFGHYLVVSHGAMLNSVMKSITGVAPHANYQGAQFRFRNTAFATLSYLPHAHRWYIEGLNDRYHWSEND
ncbi:MAG TPA: histidine phosphatase family protein [Anaerolineales bacterium]|nr:histidine phosphatase family protein [Anaerolineales bacterium]